MTNFFGRGLGSHAQFFCAQRFEVGSIEADEIVLVLVEAQHLRGEGFKREQQFAVVLHDERNIWPAELDVDFARFNPLRVTRAIAGGDAKFEAHAAKLVE